MVGVRVVLSVSFTYSSLITHYPCSPSSPRLFLSRHTHIFHETYQDLYSLLTFISNLLELQKLSLVPFHTSTNLLHHFGDRWARLFIRLFISRLPAFSCLKTTMEG